MAPMKDNQVHMAPTTYPEEETSDAYKAATLHFVGSSCCTIPPTRSRIGTCRLVDSLEAVRKLYSQTDVGLSRNCTL